MERSVDAGERCLPGPRGAPCGARGALGALSGGGIIGIRLPPSTLAFRKGPDGTREGRKWRSEIDLERPKYLGEACKIAPEATTCAFSMERLGLWRSGTCRGVPLGS